MGIGDWAKSKVRSAAQTASQVSNQIEKGASQVKQGVTEAAKDVKDTASAAVDQVKKTASVAANDLVNQVEAGKQRVEQVATQAAGDVKHIIENPFESVNRAADRLGSTVQDAGRTIEQGGRLLEGHVPFADEIRELGQGAQQAGQQIQDAPEQAAHLAGEVEKDVNGLVNQGRALVQRAEQAAERGLEAVEAGIDTVRSGVDTIAQGVQDFGQHVADSVNYNRNIDQLGDGDKYTIGVGANASVEGGKIYSKGAIEVERKGNQYVVSVDGELGGGIYGEIGGKLGPAKASGSAEATLGIGGKVEMTFDSPEEAKRATDILMRSAAVAAAQTSASVSTVPGSGLAADALGSAIGPSSDDLRFLADHTSAVELRGNVAAELAGSLGVADKGSQLAGLFAKGNVKRELTARVEFGNGQSNPAVVFKDTLSGEVALGGGLGFSKDGGDNGASTGVAASIVGKGKLEHEQRFELPAGLDTQNLLEDPLGTINSVAQHVQANQSDKVSLTLEGEGQAAGNSRGFEAKFEATGNVDQMLQSGALGQAVQGDFQGALQNLGDQVQVEASIKPYETHGLAFSPGISVMGFGVGIEGQATRRDFSDKPMWTFKGNGTDTAGEVGEQFQKALEFIQEHPEYIRASTARSQFPIRG